MEVKAKWAGRGFALCIGEWKLYVDDKDVTDKIPEDLRTESMNTYKRSQQILIFSVRSSKQSMKRIFALTHVVGVFNNKIITFIYGVVINKFYNKGDIYD